MGLVVWKQLEHRQFDTRALGARVSNCWPSSWCKTTRPIRPVPLGVMLVTVNLAMPHGTCSLETAELEGRQFDTRAL
ncbi:unnamed protein product, partial [Staurois parvus]